MVQESFLSPEHRRNPDLGPAVRVPDGSVSNHRRVRLRVDPDRRDHLGVDPLRLQLHLVGRRRRFGSLLGILVLLLLHVQCTLDL